MAKKRRKQNGTCTFCGAIGDVTDDHIPPQNLFPAGVSSPYVPARKKCNGGASADDEHFRAVVALRLEVEENAAVQKILPAVVRGLVRSGIRGNTGHIVASAKEVPTFSPFGGWNGTKATYDIDMDAAARVVARTVRGLYFLELGRRLPETHGVDVNLLASLDVTNPDMLATLRSLSAYATSGKVVAIDKDVFAYAMNGVPEDPAMSVWTMMFYGHTAMMCFTVPRADPRMSGRVLL